MSNIEKIRQEIERLKGVCMVQIKANPGQTFPFIMEMTGYDKLLAFIGSLPDENNPEPYNPVYDEDYLNEKIAKATKSWEGVDVDKMLAECRGYEEKPSEDLEEAAEEYAIPFNDTTYGCEYSYKGFIAGAEWMAKQGVTFTAAVDHYEDFYLDSCDQEAEAIKKLGLKVMDWAIVQIRKK